MLASTTLRQNFEMTVQMLTNYVAVILWDRLVLSSAFAQMGNSNGDFQVICPQPSQMKQSQS